MSGKRSYIRSFFWPAFSLNWDESGYLLCKSPYSVRTRGNTDEKNGE